MPHRFIRDSFLGRFVYHLSKGKYFSHKEENPDYIVPDKYLPGYNSQRSNSTEDFEKIEENELTNNAQVVVDWDGDDDPENPYNWPTYQKVFVIFEIAFLTASVYMGSAIYTPGIEELRAEWGLSRVEATLPLTLFIFGYGIGPMILAPMSENAIIGRTNIYIITLFLYVILQIPIALSKNIASLTVLRFLAGFFASPALANGGASIGDLLGLEDLPAGIAVWSIAACVGPSFGPFFGTIFVQLTTWRWTFWFMLIINAVTFSVLLVLLPETYLKTLLFRKAKRLRKVTGNENITSIGEIENLQMTKLELVKDILWRPIELTIFEPVVLFINLYLGLIYSVMYLWFEAFPIVFLEIYHFNLIEMGVGYLAIIVGISIGAIFYLPYTHIKHKKPLQRGEVVHPENLLPISILGGVLMPIGVFIFAWTASPDTHWIGPIIGTAIFAAGVFPVFQTLFNYLSLSFPRYMASAFASNDIFRSTMAGAFPLFGSPLFNNLATEKFPVAWGSSILAFILVGMISIPILFNIYGPRLRARSKYSGNA